jgi:hypothetical protein
MAQIGLNLAEILDKFNIIILLYALLVLDPKFARNSMIPHEIVMRIQEN